MLFSERYSKEENFGYYCGVGLVVAGLLRAFIGHPISIFLYPVIVLAWPAAIAAFLVVHYDFKI